MTERRHPTIKIGRRKTDIPVVVLEKFKDEMKEHMEETVRLSIETYVNGGIRGIKTDLAKYVEEDEKWKRRAEPLVVAFEGSKWGFGVLIAILKFFGLLVPFYGGYLLIKNFWNP